MYQHYYAVSGDR